MLRKHYSTGAQFLAQLLVLRHCPGHEVPKSVRVIHLSTMTEFVHDDVVGQVRRQKSDFIIKRDVTLARTAPPPRLLVADTDASNSEAIVLIEMRKPLFGKMERHVFVFRILPFTTERQQVLGWSFVPAELFKNPMRLLHQKSLHMHWRHPLRNRHYKSCARIDTEPHLACSRTHPQHIHHLFTSELYLLLHVRQFFSG